MGELPLSTQARLLRVLENGEFLRVGSSKVEKTNVRIVCATNVNLPEAVSNGRFREDLYYRLSTVPIKVPALRNRGEDIFLLFKKFTMDFAAKYNIPRIELDEQAKRALLAYSWPGNIRQLKNVAEQVSILELNRKLTADVMLRYLPEQPKSNLPTLLGGAGSSGKTFESEREILYSVLFDMRRDITELKKQIEGLRSATNREEENIHLYAEAEEVVPVVQHQPQAMIHITPSAPVHHLSDDEYVEEALSLDDMERKAIKQALERHRGRRRDAARDLNISERTLYRKIKEYGIE